MLYNDFRAYQSWIKTPCSNVTLNDKYSSTMLLDEQVYNRVRKIYLLRLIIVFPDEFDNSNRQQHNIGFVLPLINLIMPTIEYSTQLTQSGQVQHVDLLWLLLSLILLIMPLFFQLVILVVELLNFEVASIIRKNINNHFIEGAENCLRDVKFDRIGRVHFNESMEVLVCFKKDTNGHTVGSSSTQNLLLKYNLILDNFQILLLEIL